VSQEKEDFLDRWSRLKRDEAKEQAAPPAEKQPEEPMPVLPPTAELKPESDFKPFMDRRVDLGTRREALKKLFSDAHFNIPDPFEPYSIDLTGEDPIPAEMLKTLNQARRLIFDETEPVKEEAKRQVAQAKDRAEENSPPEPKDVAGKQDA
jgi:hypothetical protein